VPVARGARRGAARGVASSSRVTRPSRGGGGDDAARSRERGRAALDEATKR
jgi:hypothetical protein|tara:strand:+ start:3958 stop:4110 length:153 start_codon:yes stop_codon:yes gene_type:complete